MELSTRDFVYLRVPHVVGMHVEKLTGMSLWGACHISDSELVAWAEDDVMRGSVFDTDPVPEPNHPNLDQFVWAHREGISINRRVHAKVEIRVCTFPCTEVIAALSQAANHAIDEDMVDEVGSEVRKAVNKAVWLLPSDPNHPNLDKFLREIG